jgi:hypothetical protein
MPRTARALIVIALLTILTGVAWSQPPSPSPNERLQPEQTEAAKPQQPANANQSPASAPPIIVNVTAAPKAEDEKHEEAREREEKTKLDRRLVELTADLAFFTAALFYATGALVLATVVLAIIGFIQSRDMKASIAAAEHSAAATEKAALAAERSANLAEDAFRRLERPYLFVHFDNMSTHMLQVKFVPHGIPYLTFKFVNFGKMPAILRSISVGLLNNPTFPLIRVRTH